MRWRYRATSADSAAHLALPVFVYESIEGHAIFPAGGEVCDVDIVIPVKQQPGDVNDANVAAD